MKITKVIAETHGFVSGFDGPKHAVGKFPSKVAHCPIGSLIFLKEDPRFSWVIGALSAPPAGCLYLRELVVNEEIGHEGYFCFKSDTSLMIDLPAISEMVMLVNARAGLPGDSDEAVSRLSVVKEILIDDIDRISLFRLSEGFEEMHLARSPSVIYAKIAGAAAKAMLDDRSRGYFLGFEFRKHDTVALIIRSVFETLSDVDFVLEGGPPCDASRVLSYF